MKNNIISILNEDEFISLIGPWLNLIEDIQTFRLTCRTFKRYSLEITRLYLQNPEQTEVIQALINKAFFHVPRNKIEVPDHDIFFIFSINQIIKKSIYPGCRWLF